MGARVLILCALALAGCMKKSKLYCERHPTDLEHCGYTDAGIDARPTCTSEAECTSMPAAPHCELSTGVCVECYDNAHCAANPIEKFCDTGSFLCTSCVTHQNCSSLACLPNGECGDDTNTAYVDPLAPTENRTCTRDQKCNKVALAIATMRPNIKLEGQIVEAIPKIASRDLTFIAEPGTTLSNDGVVLSFEMGCNVAIYDLTIIGGNEKGILSEKSTLRLSNVTVTGCNAHDKRAIESKMQSTLIITRSNIVGNAGGGIFADGTYQITNTFIVRNGADDGMTGGTQLTSASPGLSVFEMNTVVDNRAKAPNVAGLRCGAAVEAPNNIIARNVTGLLSSNVPALGGCNTAGSLIAEDVAAFRFVMPEGAGPWDYHLDPGSMAIDSGVASMIKIDVDGQARPYNMMFDVGADEYRP